MTEFGASSNGSDPEMFFRVTDRLQMESCATAMAHDGKSVVISSTTTELLDYYGAAFVRRIKQELPQNSVEVFMPSDTDAMLDRFNKLLSAMKLDEATQPRAKLAPEKIWVVHDANALASHELDLFTRLILQFPGAGIGAVLMFTGEPLQAETIAKQNKQFVAWTLELPTAEQKLSAIQQARKSGNEESALAFFNRLSKATPKKAAPFLSAADAANAPAKKPDAKTSKAQAKTKKSHALAWTLVVLGLLALSVGVTAWLRPEFGDQAIAQTAQLWRMVNGSPEPIDDAGLEKGEEKIEPSSPVILRDEANNPMPVPGVPDSRTPVAETPPPAPVAPVIETKPEPAPEPQKTKPIKVVTELPETAVQGRAWLKGLPEESFVLEHQHFATLKDAQSAIKGKEWLANARIVPLFADGKDEARFAVVTGPFKSKDRAKNTIARLGLSNDVAIKAVPVALAQAVPNKPKP
jgi:hypothetical protein